MGVMNISDRLGLLVVKISGGVVIASVVIYVVWKKLRKPEKKVYPRDTAIIHQIGRGLYAPSLTPFAVKLETYVRMAKIPYENVHSYTMSKKGKVPWMEYNGVQVADSEFCIEFLNSKRGIDLNKNFSPRDRGVARAFQKMLEENTYWIFGLDRWVYDKECKILKPFNVPFYMPFMMRRNVKKMAYATGIGRHSQDEVYHIMERDLKSLSDFLGENKFILGELPCQEDCAIFGILSQLYWNGFGNRAETIMKKYSNLCDYCERMKEKFWPDWDECITKGGTQTATK